MQMESSGKEGISGGYRGPSHEFAVGLRAYRARCYPLDTLPELLRETVGGVAALPDEPGRLLLRCRLEGRVLESDDDCDFDCCCCSDRRCCDRET